MSELKSKLQASGLVMPEVPRSHGDKLYVSDIYGERVVTCDTDGVVTTVAEVPNWPSGLGFG